MHGRGKYKVTIRVVDHPSGTTASSRDTNNVEISEQKTASSGEDNIVSSETKSVYKSCVSLELSKGRNRSSVDEYPCCSTPTGNKVWSLETKGRTHNSSLKEGMLNSTCRKEFCECVGTKPLLGSQETASLNIYKLTRYNATIDEECPEQVKANVNLNTIGACEFPKPLKFITTQRFSPPRFSSANFRAKHGVYKQRNGFSRHLPSVVLSSANMDDMNYEQSILTDTNGIQDGFLPDFDALGTRSGRPPLNREGSACSSDSIITEIEGLTDEEGELKGCSNEGDDTPCEESAAKSNTNWKKIRGMIHWAPFAKSYKKKYPWVQLAGHQGNFKAGEQGTILKKTNDIEKGCLINLMKDVLRPYVPEFKREVVNHEESYLVLQDLLFDFESPSVMDCKMGVRTFLEDELEQARKKPKLRKDLFQKMVDVDPDAPTEEERKAGGISKPRYMKWREELSSSASLGFRIEGIKKSGEKPNKDFKTTRSREDLCEKFRNFIHNDGMIKVKYIQRLKAIRGVLESSSFFKVHEVIGSSLLFVHDCHGNVNVWMIDFAKTIKVEDSIHLTHRAMWQEGNHEDGYLFGLDNMISIWSDV